MTWPHVMAGHYHFHFTSLRAPSMCLAFLAYMSVLYVCVIIQVAAGEVAMLASERELLEEREEEMRQQILTSLLYRN